MARSAIPDALQMKQLRFGGESDDEKDRIATLLRAAGRRFEALLLFQGRPDHPFLAEERDWAIAEGNAFHLLSLRRVGLPISDEDLAVCARTAETRGRWLDARLCWVAVGDETSLAQIAPHLPEGLRPASGEAEEAEAESR